MVKPSVGHLGVQERPSEESEGEQSNRRGGFESAANRRINKPQPPRADQENPVSALNLNVPRPNQTYDEPDREEADPESGKKPKKDKKEKKEKKDKKHKKHKKDKKDKKEKKKRHASEE